ncbi:PREDICTED: phytosulfokine receptor 1-like [Prunus mume]|uniref:Phytosulfokine receptor 1-like n=1 Tax=Prunus mume TaxID=102107 RepID=A0ABM0N8C5_PRUMU|nr:PREDICTED: phytosulfokine receptor 1-like [Prunus mume]
MGAQDFWVVIIVIGFCFQAQVSSSQNLTCNPNDLKALEDFMKGIETVIEGWGNNLSSNCCEWAGITCNSSSSLGLNDSSIDTYRVVKLELPKKRLAGNLSESLGMLDQIRTLNLSHNFLKHSLPIPLFHLPNLELLDLSCNDFSGPIPADIDLPSIQSLDISQNFLNGSLPPSICNNSTQLRALNLAVNYFTGVLPPGLGNCSALEDLDLSTNALTCTGGLSQGLFRLQKLTRLSIQDNKFSGRLSKEIGNLINLVRLDISTNLFSGTIPDVFHRLRRLQYFVAHSNNFDGQMPPSLSASPTLSLLNVRNNSLQGSIDLNCSAMNSVASIDLGSNRFYGPIPSNLPSCRNLNNLNLGRNNFSGQIPESFKNFHSLSYLSLSNSSISNISSALKILQHCQNLTTLVLTLNFRDEELPADPTLHFERLKVLIIANCRLTGSLPQWLSSSSRLQLLDLSWNRLEGTIPVWFGNFSNLFYLDLSNNSFTGEIPRSITGLRSLIDGRISIEDPSLDFPLVMKRNESARGLQYNQVWSFPSTLELSNNNLSGPIWPEFGKLRLLHVFYLKCNNLSGPIPSNLSGMTSLETLDMSGNRLSGIIPPSLVNLSFLSKFNVADNELHGMIPAGGQFWTFSSSSFEGGNNNLCGGLTLPCPPEVPDDDPSLGPWPPRESNKYTGMIVGMAVGFVFGITCFIGIDRYVWTF